MAISATRVMATCSLVGQAAGTAAALAVKYSCSPRVVAEQHIAELQQVLMDDDCYLPGVLRPIPQVSLQAKLSCENGDAQVVRNGIDRVFAGQDNGWWGQPGEALTYTFGEMRQLSQARLVLDSDQSDKKRMPCWIPKQGTTVRMPGALAREFALEACDAAGNWQVVYRTEDKYQRLVRVPLAIEARAVRFVPLAGWGADRVHLMAFDLK